MIKRVLILMLVVFTMNACRIESMFFPTGIYQKVVEEELDGEWMLIESPDENQEYPEKIKMDFSGVAYSKNLISQVYASVYQPSEAIYPAYTTISVMSAPEARVAWSMSVSNLLQGDYVLSIFAKDGNGNYTKTNTINFKIVGSSTNDSNSYGGLNITYPQSGDTISNTSINITGILSSTNGIYIIQSQLHPTEVTDPSTFPWNDVNGISNWSVYINDIPAGEFRFNVRAMNTNGDVVSQNYVIFTMVNDNTNFNLFQTYINSPLNGEIITNNDFIVEGNVESMHGVSDVQVAVTPHYFSNANGYWYSASYSTDGSGGTTYSYSFNRTNGFYTAWAFAMDTNGKTSPTRKIDFEINAGTQTTEPLSVTYDADNNMVVGAYNRHIYGQVYSVNKNLNDVYVSIDNMTTLNPAEIYDLGTEIYDWEYDISTWAPGNYTVWISAADASGNNIDISTNISVTQAPLFYDMEFEQWLSTNELAYWSTNTLTGNGSIIQTTDTPIAVGKAVKLFIPFGTNDRVSISQDWAGLIIGGASYDLSFQYKTHNINTIHSIITWYDVMNNHIITITNTPSGVNNSYQNFSFTGIIAPTNAYFANLEFVIEGSGEASAYIDDLVIVQN